MDFGVSNAWAGNWDLVAVGYCLWFLMTEFTWRLCTLNLSSLNDDDSPFPLFLDCSIRIQGGMWWFDCCCG